VKRLLILLFLSVLPAGLVAAPVTVDVYEPYLELHTGPGRGYPITFVVPRGEQVTILKRRTDWFKIRDSRGREGWASREQMARTFTASGAPLPINDPSREQFGEHEREAGFLAGDFGGANVITAYGAYAFNPHLSAELRISQILGNSSDGQVYALGLSHVFRSDWRIQPFVSIGTGVIRVQPKATLVQTSDRSDQLAYVGAGLKAYVSRRFIFRAEYNKYVVFTERDDNQEPNEWKLGFAFFF
jgi:hypothetical protein